MENIEKASSTIRKLVDHLRNFSRTTAEEHEILDLYETIDDALFIVGSRIKKSDIHVQNKIDKNRCFVKASQNNMEQVFVNLLTNACDAMAGQDERTLTLSLSSCRRNNMDFWRCDISDTGIGIPEDKYEAIFQSFYTTKEKGKGTGLGLSIARGIVTEHDGWIEVSGGATGGTTFSVFIPQTRP